MKLLASGCSLIYGSELADEKLYNKTSNATYPALLAQHFGMEYACVATPGNGNDAIARSIVANLDQTVAMVVVNWSFSGRHEFYLNGYGWQNFKAAYLHRPIAEKTAKLAKFFVAESTPQYELYKYLHEIVFLQNYLKLKNIPYIFSTANPQDLDFDAISKLHAEQINLYNCIDFNPWFFWADEKGKKSFLDWARDRQLAIGSNSHPLEEAHKLTFEDIKRKFYNEFTTSSS